MVWREGAVAYFKTLSHHFAGDVEENLRHLSQDMKGCLANHR